MSQCINDSLIQWFLHSRQKRSWIIELAGLPLRPLIEPRGIHNNLPVGRQLHVRAVHGSRRWSLKINSFAVITAAVARALELVLAGFPVRRAAKVRAAGVDHKHPVGSAIDPYAKFLLELSVHTQRKLRGITDLENAVRFEKSARQKETEECNEPRGQKTGY